jgi:hypothetical protein
LETYQASKIIDTFETYHEAMLMLIGGAESTAIADDEPSTLVGVVRSAMVGEGASESIDLDPVVPTVGAN